MVVATLSTSDKIGLVVAATGVLALVFTAFNAWLAVANERKRTQPIVVAHEEHGRRFSEHADFFGVGAYVTNEGNGVAFNVRFGVEFQGVRYPYKLRGTDPRSGNVQRVLRASERRPAAGCWEVLVDQLTFVAGDGDPDPRRLYWARYENAYGKTWETINPGERSARLDIRRVRLARLREWRDDRARLRAHGHGVEWERNALAELLERSEREDNTD
jgi:hypothetical protein